MKKFFRFFISKQFLINLGLIAIVWIVIVYSEIFYLDSTTNHGEEIAVPSFYKIHMDDLDEFVQGKDIDYVITDSVYLDDWPKGTVCWQYPRPTDSTGMHVKKGRTIELSVVPVLTQMVSVPNTVFMSQRMAETTLHSLGFRTKVSYEPSDGGKGFVLKQMYNGAKLDSGKFIPKGSRIELVVSKGESNEATALPNLIGMTIKDAKDRLMSLTLTIAPQCENCLTEQDFLDAVITNQSPMGGENVQVAAGTTITVWALKGGGSPQ